MTTFADASARLALLCALIIAACNHASAQAQPENPKRGFQPANSYALGDIETINTTNGNMVLNIPVGSLPAGRGGLSATFRLLYNGKLYDSNTEYVYDQFRPPQFGQVFQRQVLDRSNEGGWRYGAGYQLQLFNRMDQYLSLPPDLPPGTNPTPQCPDSRAFHIWKLKMSFPDGSMHEFRPHGYTDYQQEGYYNIRPDGRVENCSGGSWVTGTLTYYSTDGTFLRLDIQHDADEYWWNNPWTLYFPDGGRVTLNEPGASGQRIYDRNNNQVELQNITHNGHPAVKLVDQLGRWVILEYNSGPNQDSIHEQGTNGQAITWMIQWASVLVNNKKYYTINFGDYSRDEPPYLEPLSVWHYVVTQITLPQPGSGLNYTFAYNPGASNPSYGWGEISSITLPTGTITPRAQASYQYYLDGRDATNWTVNWKTVLQDQSPKQKDLTYLREYDGATSSTTETWTYNIFPALGDSIIGEPDGGMLREYFYPLDPQSNLSGYVYKTETADGKVIERIWQENKPAGIPLIHTAVNPYVKTEFISEKDMGGTLVKTAIKDYKYDKNGNVTQVVEYDWVVYGSVQRDGSGKPMGIPGGLTPKRVTASNYYSATPEAADTTTDDPDVYHKPTSPQLKRAVEAREVCTDLTCLPPTNNLATVLARTEYVYDSITTTGNLITEKSWDNYKDAHLGGTPRAVTRPLIPTNSISVTHQYDSYGNRTWTTDANGVQTQFLYDSINGHANLYVTQTRTAYGTSVQRHSTQQYDFYTGQVTQSTDVDNNVTTKTTFDVFGRPTLVEEADGTPNERQTATQYLDDARRVIVRKDLDTVIDGKLISIQHYDQLGRVRLTRRLESGAPAEASVETKGVKIQTRYAYSGSNSYDLVSAPYRADYSSNAGNEPGMAWKRTKHDSGGRVIEVETFVGATLPAPWGSNTTSSGKFTTAYDAEFTTVTDQALKKRRSQVDGLGRLARVDEPDASGNLGTTAEPVQPTDYSYNALDNLIGTSQTGVPNGGTTSVTQTRTFTFSSLGRLITATNPESGLISHEYDANGNLKKKTDARGIYISYTYDALNRNTKLDYSDTPVNNDITRYYDNPNPEAFGKGKFWHDYAGGDYTTGQNVEHKAVDSYDALGRPLSVRREFKRNSVVSSFTTTQTYDLADHVKTKTYPLLGHSVAYTYNVAGDLISMTGNLGDGTPRTYSTGLQYNPQGQMTREQFVTATALYHRRHYNSRGQLFDVRLGTDSNASNDGPNPAQWTNTSWNRGALRMYFSSNNVEYNWPAVAPLNNNGNLYRQDVFVPTTLNGGGDITAWIMGVDYYGYDALNRLVSVDELPVASWVGGGGEGWLPQAYAQRYRYDRFGNRTLDTGSTWGIGINRKAFAVDGATNRLSKPTGNNCQAGPMSGMCYDLAGNLTFDDYTGGGNRTYDAENRMLTATGGNGQPNSYAYDADGHRTRRTLNNNGQEWWQIYGISGELVAEYQLVGGSPTLRKEYGYRNGQLLVIAEATGACQWLVTDALGTPRMLVDQTGSLSGIKRRDYLPFGEELQAGIGHRQASDGYGAAQGTRQQFTGKERDDETGLDYFEARYYASVQGRFTSPDEFTGGPDELYDFADNAGDNPLLYAEKGEPQSLNKYQYCYNNPLVYTDVDGHKPWDWVKAGLEVASWVPGPIGTGASLARAGIAVAEGDYKGAVEHAAGAIPGGKVLVKAAKALDKVVDGAKIADKLSDVSKATKPANRAAAPCGLCFTAGTKVSTPDGLVSIEDLRVGDKVTTTNVAKDKPDGWTAVEARQWRVVKLLMPDPKGSEDVYEIELLRSLQWIREVGAAARRWIDISLPEMGLTGRAKVVAITACPKIKVGAGRVVLATVTHLDQGVLELEFSGLAQALEPTASHPLFSADRNDWVPAGQLRVGEHVRTKTGSAKIEAIRWQQGEHRVYNIEVEADHSYFVSEVELLSHNDNPCQVRRFMSKPELKQLKKEGIKFDPEKGSGIPTTTTNFSPATQGQAKKRTGARSAQYQVDLNVTGLPQGPTRKTKSGLPEYPIQGDLTKDRIISTKKLPE